MTTINNIAQRILDENDYSAPSDISLTNLEYLIDNAIDTVNLRAGTTIADLSGSAETKAITASESEILVVKELTVLVLRAYLDRGPNVGVSGLSVSAVLADPQYAYFSEAVKEDIARLQELPIVIKNDPLPNE